MSFGILVMELDPDLLVACPMVVPLFKVPELFKALGRGGQFAKGSKSSKFDGDDVPLLDEAGGHSVPTAGQEACICWLDIVDIMGE